MCKYCKFIDKKHFQNPKDGDLRIWWIPQVPMKPYHYPVKSIEEAKHMLDMIAYYDLFQLEHDIKPDFSNVGGLQVYEEGEWVDWYDEDGNSIDEINDKGEFLEDE